MHCSITSAFIDVANHNSQHVAVVYWRDGRWHHIRYSELLERARTIANWLLDSNVSAGDAVVLPSRRTPDLCGQLMGILWAGAHYVFLDTEYPVPRQQFICSQVGAKIGICAAGEQLTDDLPLKWQTVPPQYTSDHIPPVPDDPQSAAYVVFTSGSTGTPKGAVIPHSGVNRLVLDTDYIAFDNHQVFLQLSALSFDASTLELFGPLLNGGTCVLYPENATPNSERIRDTVESCSVTTLWLTSSLYNTIISEHPECLRPVKQLLIGGEALSVAHVEKGLASLPDTQIFNGYGPTENTTFTTIYPIPHELPGDCSSIPIGFPIKGTHCEVFDEGLKPVADGEPGQLIAFGSGLALEYLGRPDLTSDRFCEVTCRDGKKRRGYLTGDVVIRQADGCYLYVGRNDKQVKIDGHRIEPGEIELFLNKQPQVDEARVVVRIGPQGQKRLAAYIVGRGEVQRSAIRRQVADAFPRFMVPHFIVPMSQLPKNQNGKLDEARLPDPFEAHDEVSRPNQLVADCWREILGRGVAENDNFLDAGGTSLEALQLIELLGQRFHRSLDDTFVFEYPTINAQSRFLGRGASPRAVRPVRCAAQNGRQDIAVVGIACRFPGASNLKQYWDNLIQGRESVTFFGDDELSDEVGETERSHPNYVRAKGILEDCDQFDAAFFGVSPLEAAVMDPQQRIMLELAWHALEDAGYPPGEEMPDEGEPRIGVFAGTNWARYFQQYVLPNDDLKRKFGLFNASLANESDFLCPRISYKLNLTGPSVNLFTACSTGLVAIAEACSSIEHGDCELALAGGVSIATPIKSGYMYQEGGMLSRDGHCRPFDAQATGTTFNDGAGFVVLKRMDLAHRDGDNIYAVVKGFAVNNDGVNKASFTAPSVQGQVAVYDAALANAGVDPQSIGLIETHGTATPLGDPIEVHALAQSYGGNSSDQSREASCALGSVKSNIGHVIHAAGIAGFIKAVMAVKTGFIPATLYFDKPNPKLTLEKTPFYVNNTLKEWRSESPRRAAVSALGVGGTNAHVIVEQVEPSVDAKAGQPVTAPHPAYSILLSAKDKKALDLQIASYQQYFASKDKDESAVQAAYTSLVDRRHFPHRAAVSGLSAGHIAEQLGDVKRVVKGQATATKDAKLGFMFSGQGSQRLMMGRWLYDHDASYRELFDEGSDIVLAELGFDLRSVLFEEDKGPNNDLDVNQTKVAQPALFLFEYGMARHLENHGCRPDFLIGHSIGEFAAAALADMLPFAQAVKLVSARGALMQSMLPGKMLAVKAKLDQVQGLLGNHLCLSAVNAPDRIVLSGREETIQAAKQELDKQKIASSVLHTSHAFHSHMMEPIVAEFRDLVASMDLKPPNLPIFSTAKGRLLTPSEATDPSYFAMQLRHAVLFADAIEAVRHHYAEQSIAFVEVGPSMVLSTLVSCQNSPSDNLVLASAPSCGVDDKFVDEFYRCLNRLWVSGFEVDWLRHFGASPPGRDRLPGYAFLPNKHWLQAPVTPGEAAAIAATSSSQLITQKQVVAMSTEEHSKFVEKKLRNLLEDVTGFDFEGVAEDDHFGEVGLDSLLLTQVATAIDVEFSVDIAFRHLVEEYTNIGQLRDFLAEKVPPQTKEITTQAPAAAGALPVAPAPLPAMAGGTGSFQPSGAVEQLIVQQLQIMQMQLQALGGGAAPGSPVPQASVPVATDQPKAEEEAPKKEKTAVRQTPGTRISREKIGAKLTQAQQAWIDEVLGDYQKKFAKSKQSTQEHRRYFSDPRTVSGFSPEWKEIVFPIVTCRSKGSKLWDIDGNELIDISNGFGPIFFGHSPDFVTEAVKQQLDQGIETGPQSPLAGEVAKIFCEMTGNERCTFANTGSEAVLGAIRLARTVTGRQKVAMFEGSYHGIVDEVLSRPGKNHQALPAAPGIPREKTNNMSILPWGASESLDVLREMGQDLAAVIVEPVQSRHPEFHDRNYLQEIRNITEQSGTAMILDEVVTGFRVHPGGIRKLFDIDSDMTTYGKVIGGGYPIGLIGGKAKFMDALDGGYWEYGDDSIPECGVTFFAGTFVRHPPALAAARAVLLKIKAEGAAMYDKLETATATLAADANAFIQKMKCEVTFEQFASIFYISVPANAHWGHLLFLLMTLKGIHVQQYRPSFLTTAHSGEDVAAILGAFRKSLAEMISHGLIEGDMVAANEFLSDKPRIPPGARLGKNARGEPAYFIEDAENKGKYIEVGKP